MVVHNLGFDSQCLIPVFLLEYGERLEWCLDQNQLVNDNEFRDLILDQFEGAAIQLNKLSASRKVEPLDLTLEDLLNAHTKSKPF